MPFRKIQLYRGNVKHLLVAAIFIAGCSPMPPIADDFSRTLSPGGDTRFIAEVHVDLTNSVTGELIWSGLLSRYHNVVMGSYMHDAPARAAMRQAFSDLFAGYPNVKTEQM